METRPLRAAILLCLLIALAARPDAAASSFAAFESGQVRPLALSPDGAHLYAVNTPDNRLEIFDVTTGLLEHIASVPVGMEPVAVAARPGGEVWVVNHLSDNVTVVDTSSDPPHVLRTLFVGDEPNDIVFAGPDRGRAFVTTAHRGQNSPHPRGEYATPGVGRADVWVFDADAPGDSLGGAPIAVLTLFGDKPRALAASPDGSRVYAAVFHSGNRTAGVRPWFVCAGGQAAGPCDANGVDAPGGLPAPNQNHQGAEAPSAGLIVKFDEASGEWRDELGRDWSDAIRFDLPDFDVFALDAGSDPPVLEDSFSGVGTVLFDMVVNPANGHLYVSNTEAKNEIRFEGPGVLASSVKPPGVPATVRGHLHEARITVLDGSGVLPRHLNKHIPYDAVPAPPGVKERSLATPAGMAISGDGSTLYLAAFGSQKVGVFATAGLEDDSFVPDAADHISLTGGGPTGLVLDETRGRLYVLTRFDNSVTAIDTDTRLEVHRQPLHNPEPDSLVAGRPFLYDANLTSSNGEASCSSCHVFADMDDLAWDLGNPDGNVQANFNPTLADIRAGDLPTEPRSDSFHPMKGPLLTQTLRGLANHGPMHWRGDRNGAPLAPLDESAAFEAFNGAFEGLIGRDEGPLSQEQIQAFSDFALQIEAPPNPIRRIDNTLRADEARGRQVFREAISVAGQFHCNDCHEVNRPQGFYGTNGATGLGPMKVPQLRSAYQRVGMFGFPEFILIDGTDNPSGHQGPQVRGFGFMHDGSLDTVNRFLSRFSFLAVAEHSRDLEAYIMAFDSKFAPVVGQQVTLGPADSAEVLQRVALLIDRSDAVLELPGDPAATECDLVVKGTVAGVARGWLHAGAGSFRSDRAVEPLLSSAELFALAATPGQELTLTCAPPGSGERMGLDRDEDGAFDRDELDVDTDPANAGSVAGACADGHDNDGDGLVDFPADPGCSDELSSIENPACNNGSDDDGDGRSDELDPACAAPHEKSEHFREDVTIDVEPQHSDNRIVLTRRWVDVAVLGSEEVDAADIDGAGLSFGPGSALARTVRPRDANRDGRPDLLATFDLRSTGLALGDTEACLEGEVAGVPFRSCAPVRIGLHPTGPFCGAGFELAFVMPVLWWLRRHRRAAAAGRGHPA